MTTIQQELLVVEEVFRDRAIPFDVDAARLLHHAAIASTGRLGIPAVDADGGLQQAAACSEVVSDGALDRRSQFELANRAGRAPGRP